jgi:hypothetical protein
MGEIQPDRGHPFEVFGNGRQEKVRQRFTFRFRNVSDEAEINEGDAVIGQHREIAGVGIGLIKAEVENLV